MRVGGEVVQGAQHQVPKPAARCVGFFEDAVLDRVEEEILYQVFGPVAPVTFSAKENHDGPVVATEQLAERNASVLRVGVTQDFDAAPICLGEQLFAPLIQDDVDRVGACARRAVAAHLPEGASGLLHASRV